MAGRQERATYQTNRIDLFCREWLGDDSDAARRRFVGWNWQSWFREPANATFWLVPGRLYYVEEPGFPARPVIDWGDAIIEWPGPAGKELILW